jgi:hypothetical protein
VLAVLAAQYMRMKRRVRIGTCARGAVRVNEVKDPCMVVFNLDTANCAVLCDLVTGL